MYNNQTFILIPVYTYYSYEKLGHSRKGNVKGELVLARVNAIGI